MGFGGHFDLQCFETVLKSSHATDIQMCNRRFEPDTNVPAYDRQNGSDMCSQPSNSWS